MFHHLVLAGLIAVATFRGALGADQTILGGEFAVKSSGQPDRRRVVFSASESGTDNVIVGNPTIGGATLTAVVHGTTPSWQTFQLAAGVSAITHRPFWSGDAIRGFTYLDWLGEHGPVKQLKMKISRGAFRIDATIDGRDAPVDLVPPTQGTDACVLLSIAGGDSYSIKFADGLIASNGTTEFTIKRPTQQGTCRGIAGRPVVWLFGDSITALYCPLVRQAHPEWDVHCSGRPGEVTRDGMVRLEETFSASTVAPDVVLIEEAVNDCVVGAGSFDVSDGVLTCDLPNPFLPAGAASNLQTMADTARAHGATPLLATPLYICPVPSGDTCLSLPPDAPDACPLLRCLFDDACQVTSLLMGGPTPVVDFALTAAFFFDLLHPNAAGRSVLASRAAEAIATALVP
ncbi:MAG TPA: SGNH/GDSL hydrolase family protein [Candidatus Binatia bacterium]|jgi:hypothetical protein|nr:SGNH/GDSL hydrolase family protein [Candidatus Binatia bacterium]